MVETQSTSVRLLSCSSTPLVTQVAGAAAALAVLMMRPSAVPMAHAVPPRTQPTAVISPAYVVVGV